MLLRYSVFRRKVMSEYIAVACIGIFAGFAGGALGIGGGVVMIPALVFFLGFPQHLAQGTTTAAMVLPIGILAAYVYYEKGFVNFPIALVMAGGFLIGGYFGGKIAVQLDPAILKKVFAVFLIILAVKMLAEK
jgi:uncharacterized membrane protein YfcA